MSGDRTAEGSGSCGVGRRATCAGFPWPHESQRIGDGGDSHLELGRQDRSSEFAGRGLPFECRQDAERLQMQPPFRRSGYPRISASLWRASATSPSCGSSTE